MLTGAVGLDNISSLLRVMPGLVDEQRQTKLCVAMVLKTPSIMVERLADVSEQEFTR